MQRIGFVLSPGFQVMSFAAVSVFEFGPKGGRSFAGISRKGGKVNVFVGA